MVVVRDDTSEIVLIDRSGQARPQGPLSTLRMQARAGSFVILPSPPEVLLLRIISPDKGRPCLMAGEIISAGVLCDLLSFFGQCGWRGELAIHQGSDHRSIFLDQGQVIGARSTVVRERLGEVLFRHGVLTREQVDHCSDACAGGQLRFGEVAVKAGFIAREPLFRLMAKQVEEITFGALFVDHGSYCFLQSFDETQLPSMERLPVLRLVREAVRRMHESRFFRSRIPSEKHIPSLVPERGVPTADPLGVYARIDGIRSIADLGRLLGHDEFEITRAVYQLTQSGHVVVGAPHVSPHEAVMLFNEAVALVLRELDALDEGDAVRETLSAFLTTHADFNALAKGAGPADDGTLDAMVIEKNLIMLDRPSEYLRAFLYEYASYALFLARPHLRRLHLASEKPRVSIQVTSILETIAPAGDRATFNPPSPESKKKVEP